MDMFRFKVAVLNSAEVDNDVLSAWELTALFLGSARPTEVPIDLDIAREEYIESLTDQEKRLDYQSEPQLADDEILERFVCELKDYANARCDRLAGAYPFRINDLGELIRRDLSQVSIVSTCYLVLQFYRALKAQRIEIVGNDFTEIKDIESAFQKKFEKIFEYIAAYAVAGKKRGVPYMLADCRSSKRLHAKLRNICSKIGSGQVLTYGDWNIKQKNANDGGVDCMVFLGDRERPGESSIALVAATIQSASIDKKIVGRDDCEFFKSFFTTQPCVFQGILVRPQDFDELTNYKCVEKGCLFYSYDQICDGMGCQFQAPNHIQALKKLDAKVRHLMRDFRAIRLLHEYEDYSLNDAA